ncbi:hypothetical protein V1227_08420 [Lentzea sp. DG1S-22]|uniref:hypothetical protein n=1 Tax=Lentzea sp. DG1S-22 TaxID=3108822 RepID=UPI002E79A7AA|nr:hypothetical protein [Lentzea sp. DG1S-22]WVH82764.1 hypothetical protein V1227_08420 [Lentzea sp. DG1S-22]
MIRDDESRELRVGVVLLRRSNDGHTVAFCGKLPIDLSTVEPIPLDRLSELLDSRTTLTAHAGVPAAVVRSLLDAAVPSALEQSPWLRKHRPLVFVDGRCAIDDHVLAYDERIGVYAEETV